MRAFCRNAATQSRVAMCARPREAEARPGLSLSEMPSPALWAAAVASWFFAVGALCIHVEGRVAALARILAGRSGSSISWMRRARSRNTPVRAAFR